MNARDLPRILFDTNIGTAEAGYPLIFEQSIVDLTAIGAALMANQEVVIYMPGELEMDATLRFKANDPMFGDHWIADPMPSGRRLTVPG